jgi:hypothetical protein
MQMLRRDDILEPKTYEARRDEVRREVMAEKNRRRLAVGDHVTLLFETWKTLWYQVQEMIRAEAITDPQGIDHEIETYNELMPAAGQLSATMLIEYADVAERDRRLRELVGIQDHVWLELGDRRARASFDQRQMETERVSSVQFIRFDLGEVSADAWRELARTGGIRVVIDHPQMNVSASVDGAVADALAEDLDASARSAAARS